MNTLELKPGDKIGVFFYDDWRGSKAIIEEVVDISKTGVVTLTSGIRYNKLGREVNALGEATYLCTVEKAQAIINKPPSPPKSKDAAINRSSQQRRDKAAKLAVKSAIRALNQYGWFSNTNGDMDKLESDIEQIIIAYLDKHQDNQVF